MKRHSPSVTVEPMSKDHVERLVRVHQVLFSDYNATAMGPAYLKALYAVLSAHPSCLSVVAVDEGGEVVGWIGGVKDWSQYNHALMKKCILKVCDISIAILKNNPRFLYRVTHFVMRNAVDYVKGWARHDDVTMQTSKEKEAGLLVIGVAPGQQDRNIGQLMMQDFHHRLFKEGFTQCSVFTFVDNQAGNGAFQKAGYTLTRTKDGLNQYGIRLG